MAGGQVNRLWWPSALMAFLSAHMCGQDAWSPVPQPGMDEQLPARMGSGYVGIQAIGWTQVACPIQSPTGVYGDPETQTVVVWNYAQIAISRDGGASFGPSVGLGLFSGVGDVAIIRGEVITRTLEGKVLLGGEDLSRTVGLGGVSKMAVGSAGTLFMSDGSTTVSYDLNRRSIGARAQGDLLLVIGDAGYAFVGGAATKVTAGGSQGIDVNGPMPTGWPTRTGPAVEVAYDATGCRFEVTGDGLHCTSQIGRAILVQAGPVTKNGYVHLGVADGSMGIEIACYSPRTGDARPTKANRGAPSLIAVASLGPVPSQPLHYRLAGVGSAGVSIYVSP